MGAVPRPVATVRPLLRGRLHQAFFFLSIPAGLLLVALAAGVEARIAAVVYAVGVSLLYGVSAAYHRGDWSAPVRRWMKRFDHAAIFVMIAATYTPICLLVLDGTRGTALLVLVWTVAIAGLVLALAGIAERPVVGHALYLGLGWLAVLAAPQIAERLGGVDLGLLLVGGAVYTVGAFILATRRPDPFPATFGYHEVWHLLVVVGASCHYVIIFGAVR